MTEMPLEFGVLKILLASQIIASTSETRNVTPIIRDGGVLFVDSDQLWFWTDEWQAGERRVDEYIRCGEYESFDTMEEFLRTLGE